MTDQPAQGAPPLAPDKPISVKASAAPIITSETFKAIMVGGCSIAAYLLLHSDAVIMALIPVFAIGATFTWALGHRLHTWAAMKFLADRAPDSIAVVGKKPWWAP